MGRELLGYVDMPVFWRVPLPGTPVSLATGENGLVYAVTAPHGLYAYDVEGNRLKEFSVPNKAERTDVTTDPTGNLLVIEKAYGWYILMMPEGEHLMIGGDDLCDQGAVNPVDGNIYIFQGNDMLVFAADTVKLVDDMSLDEISICGSPNLSRLTRKVEKNWMRSRWCAPASSHLRLWPATWRWMPVVISISCLV